MIIPDLKFYRPQVMGEVLDLLSNNKGANRVIAGGTDIIPGLRQQSKRLKNVRTLIDINSVKDLKKISQTGNQFHIGSAVTFSEIMQNKLLKNYFPILVKAVSTIGSIQVRNRATIGGNLVNCAPCADSLPPLLVYDARVIIRSKSGERIIPVENFLLKPYQVQLKNDELVTEIVIPLKSVLFSGDFYKLGRRRGVSISRITLALLLDKSGNRIRKIIVATGAITHVAIRFHELEHFSKNKEISKKLISELADHFGHLIVEKTGIRWSSPYKIPVVQQVFSQMLMQLCGIKE